ncbi:MAG: DUF6521 family protein [Verrucomicrobiales bacterium]|nr:DUF6521 family protein [Verrucomicrobiales bacterium]
MAEKLGGKIQVNRNIFNNFGILSIGILATLKETRELSLPELLLISPFVTHSALLGHLARKNTQIKSLEQLIIQKTVWFSNFNERYYASIPETLNAIQLLHDIELILWDGRSCSMTEEVPYQTSMGTRAHKIYNASKNLAELISGDVANAYNNLRIQL